MVGDSLFHYLRFHITEKLLAGYKILISTAEMEALYVELNERVKIATNNFSSI